MNWTCLLVQTQKWDPYLKEIEAYKNKEEEIFAPYSSTDPQTNQYLLEQTS